MMNSTRSLASRTALVLTSTYRGPPSFPRRPPHSPTPTSPPIFSTRCRCAVPSLSLLHPSPRPFPPSAFRGIAHNDPQGALAIGDEFAHDIVGPAVVVCELVTDRQGSL